MDGAAGVMAETEEEAEEFQRVLDGGRALTLVAVAAGCAHVALWGGVGVPLFLPTEALPCAATCCDAADAPPGDP